MCVCANLSVHQMHAVSVEAKRGHWPGNGVIGNCELPGMNDGN